MINYSIGQKEVSDENSNDSSGLPDKGLLLKQFETAVLMGNLDVQQVSLAGSPVLESARTDERSDKERKKRENDARELRRANDFLERIDARIAEIQAEIDDLEAQRREALQLAEEAFERAIEADELIDDIADGISPEERQRLIDLLGADAANASPDELLALLEAMRDENNATGRDQTDHADELADQIDHKQDVVNMLLSKQEGYENATTLEEKEQIKAELSDFIYEEEVPEVQPPPINLGL